MAAPTSHIKTTTSPTRITSLVSSNDMKLLEKLPFSQNLHKIKTSKNLNDEAGSKQSKCGNNSDLKRTMVESKRALVAQAGKEPHLAEGEAELWHSGDWREQIKDLNASFSKLPPISKGKKIIAGKGESFVVT